MVQGLGQGLGFGEFRVSGLGLAGLRLGFDSGCVHPPGSLMAFHDSFKRVVNPKTL